MDKLKYFTKLNISSECAISAVKAALLKFMNDKGFYFDVKKNLDSIFDCFTINRIISVWAGRSINLLDEVPLSLNETDRKVIKKLLNDKTVSLAAEPGSVIAHIYEKTISCSDKKTQGITYTPDDICEYINEILRGKLTPQSRLIDPACGCGVFLEAFYDCLLAKYCSKDNNEKVSDIHQKILSENIFGFDSSPEACAISKIVLALKYNRFVECKNIHCLDSLTDTPPGFYQKFDFVISNPPYVGHKSIDRSYRKELCALFPQVYYDKADMSYCFFVLGHKLLRAKGELIYVTGRYFMQSKFAEGLRNYILKNFTIKKIIDFYGARPFKSAGVDPLIIELKNEKEPHNALLTVARIKSDSRQSCLMLNEESVEIIKLPQRELGKEGFNYLSEEQKKITAAIKKEGWLTLNDVGNFFQGVITGCDKAFVIKEGVQLYDKALEECGRKWIKGKEISKGQINYRGKHLLYTDTIRDIESCPCTKAKLEGLKPLLMKRRECAKGMRKWYELQWGRREELFLSEKIVFPYKSDSSRFAADKCGYFFSADIYGYVLKEKYKDKISYDKLVLLLNSKPYEMYFQGFAKKLGGKLYEYYPNTLEKIILPKPEIVNAFKSEEEICEYYFERQK